MSLVTGAVACLSLIALGSHFLRARQESNLKAIRRWVRDMDIVAHGQRYQGARTEILYTFYISRPSPGAVTVKYLCRTKSGRYFDLEVTSDLSRVLRWQVDQVSPGDGALAETIINSREADAENVKTAQA